MEVIITTIICVTVLIVVGIWQFGNYLYHHGPLNAWKRASMEGILNKGDCGRMLFITPKGRTGATDVRVDTMVNPVKNTMEVEMYATFDRGEFEKLL